ncbi:uncharacterized protein [Scyliorhinus torazame]|uniref:uncharacterized protein isoform X4 n=1 Tax=Scyliorhinus torazame TaxID=75743 RepID=UPI003B5BED62
MHLCIFSISKLSQGWENTFQSIFQHKGSRKMATLKVTVFLFFILFHVLKVSSNTSMVDTTNIVLSAGTENFASEMTTSEKNETRVNTSTAAQPLFTSVLSTVQGAYSLTSTSKTEVTDSASGLEPSTAPAASGSSSLSVLAFVVIILILILVIVVVILVSVISVRFKCCDLEDASHGTRKARNTAPAESSQVNGEKESITLVSMRTLSTETGGQESSVQGTLQNDSIEAGEPDKHSQQINHAKLI